MRRSSVLAASSRTRGARHHRHRPGHKGSQVPNVFYGALGQEQLRGFSNFVGLPPVDQVTLDSPSDCRHVRQGTELWSQLHGGRLTTSRMKDVLGLTEGTAGAAVGALAAGGGGTLVAYYHLLAPEFVPPRQAGPAQTAAEAAGALGRSGSTSGGGGGEGDDEPAGSGAVAAAAATAAAVHLPPWASSDGTMAAGPAGAGEFVAGGANEEARARWCGAARAAAAAAGGPGAWFGQADMRRASELAALRSPGQMRMLWGNVQEASAVATLGRIFPHATLEEVGLVVPSTSTLDSLLTHPHAATASAQPSSSGGLPTAAAPAPGPQLRSRPRPPLPPLGASPDGLVCHWIHVTGHDIELCCDAVRSRLPALRNDRGGGSVAGLVTGGAGEEVAAAAVVAAVAAEAAHELLWWKLETVTAAAAQAAGAAPPGGAQQADRWAVSAAVGGSTEAAGPASCGGGGGREWLADMSVQGPPPARLMHHQPVALSHTYSDCVRWLAGRICGSLGAGAPSGGGAGVQQGTLVGTGSGAGSSGGGEAKQATGADVRASEGDSGSGSGNGNGSGSGGNGVFTRDAAGGGAAAGGVLPGVQEEGGAGGGAWLAVREALEVKNHCPFYVPKARGGARPQYTLSDRGPLEAVRPVWMPQMQMHCAFADTPSVLLLSRSARNGVRVFRVRRDPQYVSSMLRLVSMVYTQHVLRAAPPIPSASATRDLDPAAHDALVTSTLDLAAAAPCVASLAETPLLPGASADLFWEGRP